MTEYNFKPLIAAGTLMGIGMGGFFDGILFHQILQTHNMLSNRLFPDTVVNLEINMFWDGLFHAFTWLTTLFGQVLLWKAIKRRDFPRSTQGLVGSMFMGWGFFNFVEGIIDHQILQIHHVIQRAPNHLGGDLIFLASGVLFILLGAVLIRHARQSPGLRSFHAAETH